jgi:hypothetical protein
MEARVDTTGTMVEEEGAPLGNMVVEIQLHTVTVVVETETPGMEVQEEELTGPAAMVEVDQRWDLLTEAAEEDLDATDMVL